MGKQHSACDRIRAHMELCGPRTPVTGKLRDDLETLLRRYDEVHSLGQEYGEVELSPFLKSLIRVSDTPEASLPAGKVAATVV